MCRLSGRVDKLPKITVLGEENFALAIAISMTASSSAPAETTATISCPMALNARTTRKLQLSSARKGIHAFGQLIEVFYPLPLSPWDSKVALPSNAKRAPPNAG